MKTVDLIFDNIGGIRALYLLPKSDVQRIDTNFASEQVIVVMRTRVNIIKVEVPDNDTFLFREDMSIEDGGIQYSVAISGLVQGRLASALVREMERGEWLAVHQDANGKILLSGTIDLPLRCVTQKSSGSTTTRNGVPFTLQATEAEPSKECEGEIIED